MFNRHEIPFFFGSNLHVTSLISYFQKTDYFVLALTHAVSAKKNMQNDTTIYKKNMFFVKKDVFIENAPKAPRKRKIGEALTQLLKHESNFRGGIEPLTEPSLLFH